MIDLNDERTAEIAEVLTNKSCKKILELIAERDMNASELAGELKMPLNTIGYNIEKLKSAGLIEPAKNWWSVKGKKIQTYRVANKRIVISPKKLFSGVLPAVIVSGVIAFGIKIWSESNKVVESYSPPVVDKMLGVAESASGFANDGLYGTIANAPNSWAWFFLGALTALLLLILWNLRRKI